MATTAAKTVVARFRGSWAAVLFLAVWAGWIAPSAAQQPPPAKPVAPTPQEWAEALKAVRNIAVDTGRTPEQRANAVLAYARMQLAQGKPAEAIKTCWEVFDNPKEQTVAVAAARAACFVTRQTHGHFAAQLELLGQWETKARGGASKQAVKQIRTDVGRVAGYLMGQAGRRPVPPPIRPRMPPWGRGGPPNGPKALSVRLPAITRPRWLAAQPGQGLTPFHVPQPVAKPPQLFARDKSGVPRPLQFALPVYAPPPFIVPDKGTRVPSALVLTLPEYKPPAWLGRVQFPLLKEVKKK